MSNASTTAQQPISRELQERSEANHEAAKKRRDDREAALRSRVNPDLANALSDLRDGDLQPPAWFGVHDKPGFKKPRQR